MSNAEQNGQGHAETILELYRAHKAAMETGEKVEFDNYKYVADGILERAMESALSCDVRSGWGRVGDKVEAEQYRILLTTGGPALRIVGDIGETGEMQIQDWGTPWAEFRPTFEAEADRDEWPDAIEWFCGCFCFEC
jgi:hypothetical protein